MAKNYTTGLIITGDASGGIRAIRATDDQLGKLNQGFDKGSKRSKRFNRDVTDTSQGLTVLRRAAAPIAGMIAGMFAANSLKGQIDFADQLQKTNLRIGASTEALSQYNYVAKLSGVELNTLTTAWQRQTRRIAEAAEGAGPAADALDRIGLSAQSLKNLSPEDQFEEIAAAMEGVASESERVALAQKIWDSEGVKLVQIVNQGTDAIAAMRAEADALGLTISQETANSMATYNDEVDRLKFAAQGLSQTILKRVVPSLTSAAQTANAFIGQLGAGELETTALVMKGTAGAAVALAGAYGSVTIASGAATVATKAFNAALRVNPFVAAATALVAVTGALYGARNATIEFGDTNARIKDWLGAVWIETGNLIQGSTSAAFAAAGGFFSAFGDIAGNVMSWLSDTFMSLMGNLAGMARQTVNNIIAYFFSIGDTTRIVASAIRDGFKNAFSAVSDLASTFWQGLQAAFSGDVSFSAFKASLTQNLVNPLAGAASEISEAFQENFSRDYVGGMLEFANEQITQFGQNVSDTAFRLKHIENESEEAGKTFGELGLNADETGDAIVELEGALEGATQGAKANAGANETAATAANELAKNYQTLYDRLNPLQAAQRTYAQELATIVTWGKQVGMTTGDIAEQVRLLNDEWVESQNTTTDLADKSTDAADEMSREWERFGNAIDDTFADAFKGAFDSFDDFAGSIKDSFETLIAEMAYAALKNEIKINLGMEGSGPMPGGLGSIGDMLGGGGGSSLISGAKSLFGMGGTAAPASLGVQGGVSGTAISSANAVAGGGMGSMMGGIASAAGPAVMLAVGQKVGSAIIDKHAADAKHSLDLGGLGFGATLISKGIFGGDWQTKDAGLNLGVEDGQIQGSQFERERKSGGLFSGASYRTNESDLSGDLQAGLQATLDAQDAALRGTVEALGLQEDAFEGFSTEITKISTKGMEEGEAQAAIEDWLTSTIRGGVESVADSAGLLGNVGDALARGFESLDDQQFIESAQKAMQLEHFGNEIGGSMRDDIFDHMRIATESGAQDVRSIIDGLTDAMAGAQVLIGASERLNLQFDATADGAIHAAFAMQDLAGGVENLGQLQSSYYQNYFSEAERAAHLQDDLTASMQQMGLQLPETRDGFRELVEAQDLNTQAGRENYAQLLQLSGSFAELEGAASGADGAVQGASDAMREREGLERELMRIQGDTAGLREQELQDLDPSNRALQERIWSLQDEKEAQDEARQAQQEAQRAQQERNRELEREATAMQRAREQLASFNVGIQNWIDGLQGTDKGLGTPDEQLSSASEAFDEQFQAAMSGDRSALDSITQYADRFIEAQKSFSASGSDTTATIDRVTDMLEKLPEQLSPEQFLADEFKGLIGEQTLKLSGAFSSGFDDAVKALSRDFDQIDGNLDGLLTFDEIKLALGDKATDEQISALIAAVDTNGDGMISQQELANAKLGGLASGVAQSLSGSFDALDTNLDGLLTFGELKSGLDGMATDAQIKAMMQGMDLNNDGVISKLESVVIESMPNDARLTNVLHNNMQLLNRRQLTRAQIKTELSPIATDAEIDRLISRVDVNGDGIIDAEELTADRISGLADGIGGALEPMFDAIDLDASGLIDYNEFGKQFKGMASDAELRNIFNKLDADGDGTISRLEAVNASTKSLADPNTEGMKVSIGRHHNPSGLIDMAYNWGTKWGQMGAPAFGGTGGGQLEYNPVSGGSTSGSATGSTSGGANGSPNDSMSALRQLSTNERAELYLQRYPDIASYYAANADAIKGAGRGATAVDYAKWHHENIGADEGRLFANGGYTGPGGKWQEAGIVHAGEFVVRKEVVDQPGVRGLLETVNRSGIPAARDLPMPDISAFPLLNRNDQTDAIRDLINENRMLRKELGARLDKIEQHSAAAVQVQQAGFNEQINEQKRGNAALGTMASKARLEGSRR